MKMAYRNDAVIKEHNVSVWWTNRMKGWSITQPQSTEYRFRVLALHGTTQKGDFIRVDGIEALNGWPDGSSRTHRLHSLCLCIQNELRRQSGVHVHNITPEVLDV